MSDANEDIGNRLGSFFKKVTLAFLPAVIEASQRSSKEVTFGMTVKVTRDEKTGALVCRAQPHEPTIRTEAVDPVHFVAQETHGQMEFLMAGTLQQFKEQLEASDTRPSDDDYRPGPNATKGKE